MFERCTVFNLEELNIMRLILFYEVILAAKKGELQRLQGFYIRPLPVSLLYGQVNVEGETPQIAIIRRFQRKNNNTQHFR